MPVSRRTNASDLQRFAADALSALGVDAAGAAAIADALVWANLRGVDSHGVTRLPRFAELFDKGEANPRPQMTETILRPAVALISADHAPGAIAVARGAELAVSIARSEGVGWVSVRETAHAGAMGYYAERITRSGMIGIVMLAGMPNMAYPGAAGAAVATSPLAIGVPAGARAPFLLDMATAMIALGKINQHRIKGLPLPENAAVTAEGVPTTDANLAKMPLPLGGIKGAGLSLAFELMTSVLAGVPVLAPFHAKAEGSKRHRQNAVVIAVDPAAYGDPAQIEAAVTETLASIGRLPPLDGDAPGVPGERGSANAAERSSGGIPIPDATWAELAALAKTHGLTLPSELA